MQMRGTDLETIASLLNQETNTLVKDEVESKSSGSVIDIDVEDME